MSKIRIKLDAFMEHVYYFKHDVSDEQSYDSLLSFSNELDSQYQLKEIAFLFSNGTSILWYYFGLLKIIWFNRYYWF